MKTTIKILSAAVALLVGQSSCVSTNDNDCTVSAQERNISLTIRIPGAATPFLTRNDAQGSRVSGTPDSRGAASRAIVEGSPDDTAVESVDIVLFDQGGGYIRQALPSEINQVAGSADRREVRVRLPAGVYEIMVFANSAARVHPIDPSVANTREKFIRAVVEDMHTHAGNKWNADPSSPGYAPFPMWGTSGVQTVGQSSSNFTIELMRMIAKINVRQADTVGNFTLASVRLYNYNRYGQIGRTTPLHTVDIPSGSAHAGNLTFGPATYTDPGLFSTDPSGHKYIADEIFLFEAVRCAGTGEAQLNAATALVVGGSYTDPYGTIFADCYYRVDLQDASGFLDVERNGRYDLRITSVDGPGSDTPDKAFYSRRNDMSCTIDRWDEDDVATVLDGDKQLSLSRRQVAFDRDGGSPAMSITTTDYRGIVVEVDPASASWLTVGNYTPGALNQTITVMAAASTVDRSGYITVTSGNMRYKVAVTQRKDTWITFDKRYAYPLDGSVNNFTVNSGQYGWTATVTANPGGAMRSLLNIEGGRTGAAESCRFLTYDDLSNIISSVGNTIPFKNTVTVTFSDRQGVCPDKTIDLMLVSGVKAVPSNCYVVQHSANPLLIPVSRANDPTILALLGQSGTAQIAPGVQFGAELLASDNPLGLSPTSCIADIQTIGTGDSGWILVMMGSVEGNAIVGVTVGSGANRVKWSWHLWICAPNNIPGPLNGNSSLMDRNLGAHATSWTNTPDVNTRGDKVMGLYYQWGRKDPFPNTLNWGAGSMSGIFGNNNNTIAVSISQTNNLISNWRAAGNLWDNGGSDYKTVFDPCPAGWRIPRQDIFRGTPTGVWDRSSVYGVSNDYKGGYYPATGNRNAASFFIGKDLRVWTNVYNNDYSGWGGYQGSQFSGTSHQWRFPTVDYSRSDFDGSNAVPVRCVKI
ncbi:hypothetical protein FACS1894159_02170 [Bacteroidia bacterium]|nr:hypothetical protein FACS1894159_02170 [Bacteroidia bacterium]